jgi:hypothetical protein
VKYAAFSSADPGHQRIPNRAQSAIALAIMPTIADWIAVRIMANGKWQMAKRTWPNPHLPFAF